MLLLLVRRWLLLLVMDTTAVKDFLVNFRICLHVERIEKQRLRRRLLLLRLMLGPQRWHCDRRPDSSSSGGSSCSSATKVQNGSFVLVLCHTNLGHSHFLKLLHEGMLLLLVVMLLMEVMLMLLMQMVLLLLLLKVLMLLLVLQQMLLRMVMMRQRRQS